MSITIPMFAVGPVGGGVYTGQDPERTYAPVERAARALESAQLDQAKQETLLGHGALSLGTAALEYVKHVQDQKDLNWLASAKTQMEIEAAQQYADWGPRVDGTNATEAVPALTTGLTKTRDDILAGATSDRARQVAERELGAIVGRAQVQATSHAQQVFVKHSSDLFTQEMDGLAVQARRSGGDPAILQGVVDQANAKIAAQEAAGIWMSPFIADKYRNEFKGTAAREFVLGQLDDPALRKGAAKQVLGGVYDTWFDPKDLDRISQHALAVQKDIEHEARIARAEAKQALRDFQDDKAEKAWFDIERKGRDAAQIYSLGYFEDEVNKGNLRRKDAVQLYNLANGMSMRSDHATVDALLLKHSSGQLTLDDVDNAAGQLSVKDVVHFKDVVKSDVQKNPTYQLYVNQIKDLLAPSKADRRDPQSLAEADAAIRGAIMDMTEQVYKSNTPMQQAFAETMLKWSPVFGEYAKVPKSSYFTSIPDNPEIVSQSYAKLYDDLKTGKIPKGQFDREYRSLNTILDASTQKREQLGFIQALRGGK